MPIEANDLIQTAKRKAVREYAHLEIRRNKYRQESRTKGNATAYFLSTETKRQMSNLLYLAYVNNAPIKKSEAAFQLACTRQASSKILDDAREAGWADEADGGYMYTPDQALHYETAISFMLLTMSTSLTEKLRKVIELQEILSTHLSLTSEDRSSDNDVSEVKYG